MPTPEPPRPITKPNHHHLITAYSQQSRFHLESFDANTTDIDIKGVNISVGYEGNGTKGGASKASGKGKDAGAGKDKDILVDAHLRLKKGVKYGMVGQNGVGKSGMLFSSPYFIFPRPRRESSISP